MIIAEYTLDHPILRATLAAVPDAQITWEDSYGEPDGGMYLIAWIEGADVDAVEDAMREDPTVAGPAVLAEADDRRLYRVELVGEGRETSIMPVIVDVGGVHQSLVATADGWLNRTRFPDREAFEEVYQFCREHDIEFTFERIYEQAEWTGSDALDLTDRQRATLLEAVEYGYLDIPRRCSLAELGERLGISESAASERFRRAVRRLVEGTVSE